MSLETMAISLVAWLGTYLVHSTLVLGVTGLATARLPRRYDLLSDLLWKAALVLPIASSVVAASGWPVVAPEAGGLLFREPERFLGGQAGLALAGITGLGAAWLSGAAAGLVRLGRAYRRQVDALGTRTPLAPAVRDGLGLVPGDRCKVTVSPRCLIPTALGGEICLPARALSELSRAELRSILCHERMHEARRDPFWRRFTAIISVIFFFQPLNRLAGHRLRELGEWICDAGATRSGRQGRALARALVRVAEWSRGRPASVLSPSLLASEGLALRRVRAALGGPQRLVRLPRGAAPGFAVVLLAGSAQLPPLRIDTIGLLPYTVRAQDAAGRFTVTILRGQVTGVSLEGRRLGFDRIHQQGREVLIADPRHGPFTLTMHGRGGFSWTSRPGSAAPSRAGSLSR